MGRQNGRKHVRKKHFDCLGAKVVLFVVLIVAATLGIYNRGTLFPLELSSQTKTEEATKAELNNTTEDENTTVEDVSDEQELSSEEKEEEDSIPATSDAVTDSYGNFVIKKSTIQEIHGIYLTSSKLNTQQKLDDLIQLIQTTEINTVVFDIKDDYGKICYQVDNSLAEQIGAVVTNPLDVDEILTTLHKENIYVIARLVCFKDPILTAARTDYAVKKKDGTVFSDRSGDAWLNPYNKDCWKYILSIAADAARHGFDEIQFDYMRFSTDSTIKEADYGEEEGITSKAQIITEFAKYACEILHVYDTKVSADVFGTIINSEVDAEIVGQDYEELSRYLDYISPMIYPSHYANGCYGIEVPDAAPYDLVKSALQDSNNVIGQIDEEEHRAVVRPWLQDFTASWVKGYQIYGEKQVAEQIQAVYDAGCSQWLLWNSKGNYTTSAVEDAP